MVRAFIFSFEFSIVTNSNAIRRRYIGKKNVADATASYATADQCWLDLELKTHNIIYCYCGVIYSMEKSIRRFDYYSENRLRKNDNLLYGPANTIRKISRLQWSPTTSLFWL